MSIKHVAIEIVMLLIFLCQMKVILIVALMLLLMAPPVLRSADAKPPTRRKISVQDLRRAQVHYNKGHEFFVKGDYDGAIAELVVAIGYAPEPQFFYNISKAYERKMDYKNARLYLERYLPLAKNKKEKKVVLGRITELDKRHQDHLGHGRLQVKVNVEGAVIKVDGKAVGKAPQEPVRLPIGKRNVEV